MQGGEEPGFHFGAIVELVAFGGPDVEGLLGEVAGVSFAASEAVGEAVEGFVMARNDLFEIVRRYNAIVGLQRHNGGAIKQLQGTRAHNSYGIPSCFLPDDFVMNTPGEWDKRASAGNASLEHPASMFQLLFERSADAILLLDPKAGVFVDCNSAAVELMRAESKEKLLGARPDQLSPEIQPEGVLSRDKSAEIIRLVEEH